MSQPYTVKRQFDVRLLVFCFTLASAGCAGYNVGAPFSQEIQSVYVPVFASGSNRRFLEYQLTEAVQTQIQQRTPYRLLKEESGADTRLTGKLIDLRKTALGQTRNSDARELQVNLAIQVTWEDLRTGKILTQQRVPLTPEMLQLATQAEFAAEVGQSLATADQTAIDRMARTIVDMMEVGW